MGRHMKHISGALKCPIATFWGLFCLHFLYIGLFYGLTQEYISFLYLILDVVILFSIEISALFITLSNNKNSYNFFIISFVFSIINALAILFSISIIAFVFFVKDSPQNFMNPNPTMENNGNIFKGILLIIEKIIEIIPLIILFYYYRKLGGSSGSIHSRNISIDDDIIVANMDTNDDQLI